MVEDVESSVLSTETLIEKTIDRTTAEGEAAAEKAIDEVLGTALDCIGDDSAVSGVKKILITAQSLNTPDGLMGAAKIAQQCADLNVELELIKKHPKWNQTLQNTASIGYQIVIGNPMGAADSAIGNLKERGTKLRALKLSPEAGNALNSIDEKGEQISSEVDNVNETDSETFGKDPQWAKSLSFGISKDLDTSSIGSVKDDLAKTGISAKDLLNAQAYSVGFSLERDLVDNGLQLEFNGSLVGSRQGKEFNGLAGYLQGGIDPGGTVLGRDISTGGLIGYGTEGLEAGGYLQFDSGSSAVKAITTIDDDGKIGARVSYQVQFGLEKKT